MSKTEHVTYVYYYNHVTYALCAYTMYIKCTILAYSLIYIPICRIYSTDFGDGNSTITEEASRFQHFFRSCLAPGRASGQNSLHRLQYPLPNYPWMDNSCLTVHPWAFDYHDGDFSIFVVDLTFVSSKVCCLSCQQSDPSSE